MTDYEAMRIDQDRDPIVTDQVMRRLVASGQILHDVSTPRTPAEDDTASWRDETRALAAQAYPRARMRLEQTLGILERSLAALAEARGRKSLVLVCAGLIQDPHLAGFRRAVSEARRANAAIYSLDARGLVAGLTGLQADVSQPLELLDRSTGAGLGETADASEGSEGLALDTGGFVLKNRNDLGAGLSRIARESRSYYLIGYTPTNRSADGRFRKIAVKVARRDVEVRARRGYYAAGRDAAAKPEGRDAAIQRALDAPFDLPGLPLRAIAQAFGEAEPGKTPVRVTVEADIRGFAFAEKGGTARDTLEYLLLVVQRDSGESTRFDQQFEMAFKPETRARFERSWFPITRELPLAPGPYQAKIVARDRNSGRVGSLTHDFEVPAPDGLRVSSLVAERPPARRGEPARPRARARGPRAFAARGCAPLPLRGVRGGARCGERPAERSPRASRSGAATGACWSPRRRRRCGPGRTARSRAASGVPLDGAPPGPLRGDRARHRSRGRPGRPRRASRSGSRRRARALSASGPAELAQRARRSRAGPGSRRSDSRNAAAAPERSPSSSRVRAEAVERHRRARPGGERALEEGHGLGGAAARREGAREVEQRLGVLRVALHGPLQQPRSPRRGCPLRIRTTPSLVSAPASDASSSRMRAYCFPARSRVALDQGDVAQPPQRLGVVGLELERPSRRRPRPPRRCAR